MKRFSLLLCLSASLLVSAAERSSLEMKRIATQHFQFAAEVKAISGTTSSSVSPVCIYENEALAVFAPISEEAFVIISKSNLTDPVIGYADGRFRAEALNPNLKWYLSVVQRNIHQAEAVHINLCNARQNAVRTPVEPFVTTHWHQGDPFNLKTPKNYPAGCVAVALAQCLNYCRYPNSVSFRGYYYYMETDNSKNYTLDSLDIRGIYFYPFLDAYGRATNGQKQNVATFVRDCGYATYMQYAKNGSGTYNYLSGIALTGIFGYPEESIKYAKRAFFSGSQEEWNELIYNEMQRESPVIYGGADEEEGGHAFVFCGLDADGLVYVNWGWGGDADGFYDIALMNPSDNISFIEGQNMIYGIRPKPLASDKAEPRIYSYDGEPYTFSIVNETGDDRKNHIAIHIRFTAGMVNMTPSSFDGQVGLFGTDLTTGKNWVIQETDPLTLEPGSGYFLREPAELYYYYVEDELITGHTYRISFGGCDKYEGAWHSILCEGGEIAYDVMFTGNAATSTISEMKDVLFDGVREVNADLNAADDGMTRVFDTTGRLVHIAPSAQFNLWEVPARGILVVKQGNSVRKVVR